MNMESWQRTVASVSDKLFPDLKHSHKDINITGIQSTSFLQLQMSLYFNMFFLPFWIVVVLLMLYIKFQCLSSIYQALATTTIIATAFLEVVRLFLGFMSAKISDLAGFWMLSILLQFPLQLFILFNPNFRLFIVEYVVQSVMALLLFVQLITGYRALKSIAEHQAIKFRRRQFRVNKNE